MRNLILALILGLPLGVFGTERLAALSMLETGNNDRAIGRAGEVSRYQVLRREWRSVTNSVAYTDSETARHVVLAIMQKRVKAFQAAYGRLPNDFEYYGLWNAPSQVLRGRVSRVVAERCRRFANLCEREQQLAQASTRKVF
ncbi:MAG TPA: hypothetical protein VEH04_17755 [Verrucomicrobiae bacterium]|nr:hypothetical protein [Verrucomicrobiae bacterium]